MSKNYPIIIGSNVYPNKDGKKWRFRIRYFRSQKHPNAISVDGNNFGSYNDAKLSASLCECVLKGGGEIEWRTKCRLLSLSELAVYVGHHYQAMQEVESSNATVEFLTPRDNKIPVISKIVDDQDGMRRPLMSPCRLFDEPYTSNFPLHHSFSRTCFSEVAVERIPLLRSWREERSFVAYHDNNVMVTHVANMEESVLTLDTLGFPMLWRIMRDAFGWGWNFGTSVHPDGTKDSTYYFLPGINPRSSNLIEGLDKLLVYGRDRKPLYDFLSQFGLTGQTTARKYTEFHYGVDHVTRNPYIDIYEYPVLRTCGRPRSIKKQKRAIRTMTQNLPAAGIAAVKAASAAVCVGQEPSVLHSAVSRCICREGSGPSAAGDELVSVEAAQLCV
jgi:hypothetical protein